MASQRATVRSSRCSSRAIWATRQMPRVMAVLNLAVQFVVDHLARSFIAWRIWPRLSGSPPRLDGSPRPVGMAAKVQYLVEGPLVGDQPGGDQFLACAGQLHRIQRQQTPDGLVRVVAQALAIGDGDQKKVQRQGLG